MLVEYSFKKHQDETSCCRRHKCVLRFDREMEIGIHMSDLPSELSNCVHMQTFKERLIRRLVS